MATPNPSPSPNIDSRSAFRAAVVWGFDAAVASGARRIVCVDGDFRHWPWDNQGLLAGLAVWLRLPQRRLQLLARDFDGLQRWHPRFNRWRADWSHAVGGWQWPLDQPQEAPCLLVADSPVSVHLADSVHWRGRTSVVAADARHRLETVDVILQRSVPAWPVSSPGL